MRQDRSMPDDVDYAWLQELLEGREWSEEDLATARSLLENQQRALDEAHPRDHRNRQALEEVVAALQRALEAHGG
jgi:hypothetical protein